MAMTEEDKELWTGGLRSGEYPQGELRLVYRKYDGTLEYCCWGVLCELKGVERITADSNGRTGFSFPEVAGVPLTSLPPETWSNALGVDRAHVALLAAMNDGTWTSSRAIELTARYGLTPRRYTFSEIADFIQEHL